MKIMAVDLGDSRTGLAVCDKSEILASPFKTLNESDFEKLAQEVVSAVSYCGIEMIVVGHPINMNGSIGKRAKKCEKFAKNLEKMLNIPVILWDERQSTLLAHKYFNITNTRGKKRKNAIDAAAATIILESYLKYRQNQLENI